MRFFYDYIRNPKLVIKGFYNHYFKIMGRFWSDEQYIQKLYHYKNGVWLDLKSPRTFNEKLNWLKLNYHDPFLHKMVDKYEVKSIISERIGKRYVVSCYGVWDRIDDIDFSKLPDKFVLKGTLTGGAVCKDKNKFNVKKVKHELEREARNHNFNSSREWGYKGVSQRYLVDEFLDDGRAGEIQDYKFLCFNGEPKAMYITNKGKHIEENFYDMDFKPLDINHGFPRTQPEYAKPAAFEEMKELASKLSVGIPFVRIDFFYVNGKVFFGEYTLYDWGGMRSFKSNGWDERLGDWIKLSGM